MLIPREKIWKNSKKDVFRNKVSQSPLQALGAL